jgi:hypothetical protein
VRTATDFEKATDWSYVTYWLAVHGIPSDWTEDTTGDFEPDPWAPEPNTDAVVITLDREGAAKLTAILRAAFEETAT